MTISKFQQLYAISQLELDEFAKAQALVQVFTGLSEEQVDKFRVKKFNRICKKVERSFELPEGRPYPYLKAGKNWYKIHFDITKMVAGRYVEVTTFSTDVVGNLHKILASICTPVKITWRGFKAIPFDSTSHEQYANDMLEAPFYKAYQSMLFFSAVFKELIRSSRGYLIAEIVKTGVMESQATQTIEDLQKYLDGYIQPKWLKNLKVSL